MQLPDALLGFLLERLGGWGKVGILVAEQLVGDFAGEQHPDIGRFVNGLAHQIHTDAGADGGDVEGSQQLHHRFQRGKNVLFGDDDLGMVTVDVVRDLFRVFQVDGILAHADSKGADGLFALPGGNGAHQRGIQSAAEQETDLGVGHQTLLHTGYQLVVDVGADRFQIIGKHMIHRRDVAVADEFPVAVIMSRRKRQDFVGQPHQIFRFAGKQDRAVSVVAVIQRADADGVTGSDELLLLAVVNDTGKFRVQLFKHADAVLFIHGQQHFAVGLAVKGVVPGKLLFELFKAVNLTVADHPVAVQAKRLHPFRVKTHDGKSVKAEYPLPYVDDAGIVGASGNRSCEACLKRGQIDGLAAVPNDGTHRNSSSNSPRESLAALPWVLFFSDTGGGQSP